MNVLAAKSYRQPEPELNLLLAAKTLEQPLWTSLFENLDDFFFPRKLPPLAVTSKSLPVRDLWGFYNYRKNGVLGSTVVHVALLAALICLSLLGRKVVHGLQQPQATVTLVAPADIPPLPPSKKPVGGGGGGGDRDKFPALKGKLPRFAMEQLTPPNVGLAKQQPETYGRAHRCSSARDSSPNEQSAHAWRSHV